MKTVVAVLFIFLLIAMCLFPLENRSTNLCSGMDAGSESSLLNESPLRSDEACWCSETDERQAGIAERRISVLDVERLKKEVGIWKASENYSKIINGHGTGWRPPTEEEWTQMVENGYIVERISSNETLQTLSFVDHTLKQWFPPIGDQGGEGSCTCWAVGYYMKTFQEAREHNWDLSGAIWSGGQPSVEYQDRIISPDFIYHLINGGVDEGSWPSTAINLICSVGASSWEKMPYNPSDSASWPSEEAWREAPLYRGDSSGYGFMWINTNECLTNLKNRIASDNLAEITVDATKIYNGLWSLLTSKDMLTLDNYVPPISRNHAVTIVGYDDSFEYTEQGQTRYGAFKIANSWGIGGFMGWENVPDGCFWISYEAMKQYVGYCEFYDDKTSYKPELVASFRITHSKRGECDITIGAGSQTKSFSQYINGGDQPFPSSNILFDITEFRDAIPNVYGQQFYLKVYDGGSSTTGAIYKFAVEYEESTNPPLSTINGGSVYAYVTLYPLETGWRIGKQVNSDNDFIDGKVTMATDSNGYLYIAYEDWYPAGNKQAIFVQRSTDGGHSWSRLTYWYWVVYDSHNPSIAVDPYGNRIYVAYERETSSTNHDIYVCIYASGSPENHIGVDTGSEDDRFPSLTCEYQYGAGNRLYLSYECVADYNDRDLMFAKSTDHGNTWSIQKLWGEGWPLPDRNVYAQPSITNAEGYVYIAYKAGADYDTPCEIRVERSTDFGNSWTRFMDVDGLPNGCNRPSIAAAHGCGTVIVAFEYAWSVNNTDVYFSYSTDRGTNWEKGHPLFVDGLENEKSPSLAADGGGSNRTDITGYFHSICKVGNYLKYSKAIDAVPNSWSAPTLLSEKWVGKGVAIATQYRDRTSEFHPCVAWTDERANTMYYSTIGEVHNLNTGLKYATLQASINANETMSGDTLLAESRTYNEMVLINKSITLLGEDWTDTMIHSKDSLYYAVEVIANGSIVDGFTVKNGYIGIHVHSCSNVTIQNNLITDNEIGIALGYFSSSNKILQNNVTLNANGIWIFGSPDNFLRNNSMTANMYSFRVGGESLSEFIQDIDVSNTIEDKPIVFWTNERGKTVPVNAGYVAIINCTQITLENLDLASNGEGLLFAYTTNSSITKSNMTNNEWGILFLNCSDNTAFENNISSNHIGVYLVKSLTNHIMQNNLTANDWSGIDLQFSSDNIVIGNDVEGNRDTGIRFWNSSNNLFYHNNFVNNINQTYDYHENYPEQCPPSINSWDSSYPTGGNYWSDYNGTDLYSGPYQNETGSDGIGDAACIIDSNNQDHYPLMKPYPWASHDVGITSVTTSKTIVGQGYNMSISIMTFNYGNYTENINITVYANTTMIGEINNIELSSRSFTIVQYTWDTSGFAKGNYTISASATAVWGETDTADNNFTDGTVLVSFVGDVNGDGKVRIDDVLAVAQRFGTDHGGSPNSNGYYYDANCDVNDDLKIRIDDVLAVAQHFGQGP